MNIDWHDSVVEALQACKGQGKWKEVAAETGYSLWTIEKIARKDTDNPGIQTCQDIAKTMASMGLYPAKKIAA